MWQTLYQWKEQSLGKISFEWLNEKKRNQADYSCGKAPNNNFNGLGLDKTLEGWWKVHKRLQPAALNYNNSTTFILYSSGSLPQEALQRKNNKIKL